jgi:WD40 repeat protein
MDIKSAHEAEINDVKCSYNTSIFITGGNDKLAKIFDTRSGKERL